MVADADFEDLSFVYGLDGDDGLDGYVAFTQKPSPTWGYEISVGEFVARDPLAEMTLWRFLGGHSMQVEHITVECGPVDSLLLVLPEQDVEQVGNNRWMHRLVDAPAAIAARGFPPDVAMEAHLQPDRPARAVERRQLGAAGRRRPGRARPRRDRRARPDDQRLQRAVHRLGVARALTAAGALHHATDAAPRRARRRLLRPRPRR